MLSESNMCIAKHLTTVCPSCIHGEGLGCVLVGVGVESGEKEIESERLASRNERTARSTGPACVQYRTHSLEPVRAGAARVAGVVLLLEGQLRVPGKKSPTET